MIAMTESKKKQADPVQAELDIFLEQELPQTMKNFPVWWLAKFWHTTPNHVSNLIDSGVLECPIDLRNAAASRSLIRVPRPFVIAFINKRRRTQ